MFYEIRIVADVLECDAYRFVLSISFPLWIMYVSTAKIIKYPYCLPFPTKCRTIGTSLRTNGL